MVRSFISIAVVAGRQNNIELFILCILSDETQFLGLNSVFPVLDRVEVPIIRVWHCFGQLNHSAVFPGPNTAVNMNTAAPYCNGVPQCMVDMMCYSVRSDYHKGPAFFSIQGGLVSVIGKLHVLVEDRACDGFRVIPAVLHKVLILLFRIHIDLRKRIIVKL